MDDVVKVWSMIQKSGAPVVAALLTFSALQVSEMRKEIAELRAIVRENRDIIAKLMREESYADRKKKQQ